MKRLAYTTLFLLLMAGLLLAGCGSEDKTAEEPPKAEEPSSSAEVAAYVGSETCATCHSDEYQNWSGTMHAVMIQDPVADGDVIVGDFDVEGDPLTITGLSRDDIVYTIGSKWKQRYVVEKDGALRILPKQWIVATGEWTDYHAEDWDQRAYEDLCIACHSTGYDPATKKFELGIGCESCHGPGSLHASSGDKSKIINPADLTFKQSVDLCGSCHVRGKNVDGVREDALGFVPGDDLEDHLVAGTPETKPDWFHENGDSKKHHQQYNDFIQSKHFESGVVTCVTCHDAHGNGEISAQLKKPAEELCASCHGDEYSVEKNMPKRAKSATPGDITTHTFKAEY